MSSIVDYQDRATCIIFGDGAGAVMLEPSDEGLGIQDAILESDGSGREFLHMKAGGSVRPASYETINAREHYIFQDGQSVFRAAVKNMADVSAEIMERNNLTAADVAWLVPHQANKRIICSEESQQEQVMKRMVNDDCILVEYEEWDEGDDMKWILTFKILDEFDVKPELN